MLKRISPSPSNRFTGYNKSSSYDNRVRVSPSPPSNKVSGQNVIGFTGMGQAQTTQQMMGQQPVISEQQINNAQHVQGGMQRWTSPAKQYGGDNMASQPI